MAHQRPRPTGELGPGLAELFDSVSEHVTPEHVAESVNVYADLGRHAAWLQEYADLGFDAVMLHHVGREQSAFIDAFGTDVLPRLDVTRPQTYRAESAR
ncbi:LLM class F420-dependent oxidoreductase OS=Streptomyces microflavus OX=1919 GN=Smic_79510 PE=4 SV=1 [Streptomyces microflavus]